MFMIQIFHIYKESQDSDIVTESCKYLIKSIKNLNM